MNPDEVSDALVEKAARAAYLMHYEEARVWREGEYGLPLDEEDWPQWDPKDASFAEMLREQRHALAALLPEIQAEALEAEARTDRYDHPCEDRLLEAAEALRATTTEGTT